MTQNTKNTAWLKVGENSRWSMKKRVYSISPIVMATTFTKDKRKDWNGSY